jgi:hypothetical protein
VIHPQAAGIDVGNASHYVAVRPDRDPEPVQELWSRDGSDKGADYYEQKYRNQQLQFLRKKAANSVSS